jgi:hypothetical protein
LASLNCAATRAPSQNYRVPPGKGSSRTEGRTLDACLGKGQDRYPCSVSESQTGTILIMGISNKTVRTHSAPGGPHMGGSRDHSADGNTSNRGVQYTPLPHKGSPNIILCRKRVTRRSIIQDNLRSCAVDPRKLRLAARWGPLRKSASSV